LITESVRGCENYYEKMRAESDRSAEDAEEVKPWAEGTCSHTKHLEENQQENDAVHPVNL